jgi:hypothetical protein
MVIIGSASQDVVVAVSLCETYGDYTMAEKLTIDHMSVEMDVLWGRLKELELTLSKKLDTTVKNTTSKLKQHLSAVTSRRLGDLVITNDLRNELIQLSAYFKAERNDFAEGMDEQNWLEAEQEVDRLLLEGGLSSDNPEVFTGRASPGEIAEARKAVSKPEKSQK